MTEFNLVKVDGNAAEAAKTLADAIVDLISPASETLGLIGDVVRQSRVEVAARITQKAKKIADDNGLKLKAPPLKFLLPYYEAASLEDNEELEDLWAGLLASAGSDHRSAYNLYVNIVKLIGPEEAGIINIAASDYSYDFIDRYDAIVSGLTPKRLRESLYGYLTSRAEPTLADIHRFLNAAFFQGCKALVTSRVISDTGDETSAMGEWYAENPTAFETLRQVGLFREEAFEFELNQYTIYGRTLHPTRLCLDFAAACEGRPIASRAPKKKVRVTDIKID